MAPRINELDVVIGKNIKYFRKQRRWGLKVLADKLGISIQQLQKYETAANKISASLFYDISFALQVSLDRLICNDQFFCNEVHAPDLNVLLIEDNVRHDIAIRQAIDGFSKKINLNTIQEGLKVLEYFDFFDLKDACHKCLKPDLILLELHMSKISGIEILKILRRHKYLSSTPVVLLTDVMNPGDMEAAYELHVGGVVIKNCSQSKLKEQVVEILNYWFSLVILPSITTSL